MVTLVCLVALTLTLTGCRKRTTPQTPQPAQEPNEEQTKTAPVENTTNETTQEPVVAPTTRGELDIVPLAGVGPIDFGMSKEQVIEKLGQPDRSEGGGIAMYYLGSRGLSLLFDFRRGVMEIQCWSKEFPMAPPEMKTFAGKTEKGIAMGAERSEIIAAYGEPDKIITKNQVDALRYEKLRTDFVIFENKLVNIKVKAPRLTP